MREAQLYRNMTDHEKAERLTLHVEGLNARGFDQPDWSSEILGAAANFDVDMVRELLAAGLRADQMFVNEHGGMDDIASAALASYALRAPMFIGAAEMWAQRCAEVVALATAAGGPRWLNLWLGPEVAPVLACECLQGLGLRGRESWAELETVMDGLTGSDAVALLLDEGGALRGESLFRDPAAQARLEARIDAWFETVAVEGV